jgi:large subunit ribosomal protein L25
LKIVKKFTDMQVVQISSEPRTELGKKGSKALRSQGKIPAVIYSSKGVDAFSTTPKSVKPLVFTADLKIAEIEIGGSTRRALLKDIDFHPVTDQILHMDFIELVEGTSVNAEIPVKFKGVSPGVKAGGKLMAGLRKVKVKATPETLVDELYVDISHLQLAQAVRVMDIEVPEGIEIKVDGATPVAVIEVPRALKSATETETTAEA